MGKLNVCHKLVVQLCCIYFIFIYINIIYIYIWNQVVRPVQANPTRSVHLCCTYWYWLKILLFIICIQLFVGQCKLPWASELKTLGVYISNASRFCCNRIESKGRFHRTANAVFGRIGSGDDVSWILALVDAQCRPVVPALIYLFEATDALPVELRSMNQAYDAVFAKLFHTWNLDIIRLRQFHLGLVSLHYTFAFQLLTQFVDVNFCVN